MTLKSLITTLAFCAAAMPAANAAVISMRATGTVTYGFDQLGLFGTAGSELTGKSFSQTFSMDLDKAQRFTSSNTDEAEERDADNAMVISTTINGVTAIQSVNSGWRYMTLLRGISVPPGSMDKMITGAYGTDADTGGTINAIFGGGNAANPLIATDDMLASTFSIAPDAQFGQALDWGYTVGNFMSRIYAERLDLIELNPDASQNVPEPATAGLFAIGLLGAAMARRRKQR